MVARILFALLLISAGPAAAEDAAKGPVMGQLLDQPAYIYAWQSMMAGETPPDWVKDYSATHDGPPTPTIPVSLDGEIYVLGFTCKPNACEDNQLYVLFAPEGRDAWGLLASPGGLSWLGQPDERIQNAITGSLRK
jgi:hypothetical protein